ncbi:linear amide C-N hydrolase [Bhargavaea ullalensis]|uniref:Choloylglycine hydrolase n=1 Tax=Bhargavaea ullalensis TaxID=1265685 RepID=A0ABV2G7X4_9BACL
MCTTVGFSCRDGFVFGRTLEMGVELDNQVLFVPAGYKGFIQEDGAAYDARYATIGTAFMDMAAFGDGINEMGLMGSSNLLPGCASFADHAVDGKINLTTANAFNYLLSRCKNIKEVKEEATKLSLPARSAASGTPSGEMHFFFMDADGNRVVLEPKHGQLQAFDNPYGVLTNSPEFPWHVTNLRNYLQLQPENIEQRTWNGAVLSKFGEGTGLAGLPGDFTPPSRFVRAAFFVSATPRDLARPAAILQAFRILSQSDIPDGAVIDEKSGYRDKTLYTAVMDTSKKSYTVKCHDNINLQPFRLEDFKDERDLRFICLDKEMHL